MTYFGYFNDSNVIQKDNLDDLAQVPGIRYYLKMEFVHDSRAFTLIKPNGMLNFLIVGGFELRDISTEFYIKTSNAHLSRVTILETSINRIFTIDIRSEQSPQKLINRLLKVFDKLVETGSYEAYLQAIELEVIK